MASRRELVRMFVLDSICDDYEHLDISISPDIERLATRCGLMISRSEIIQGLSDLIDFGWAKAYRFSGPNSRPPEEVAGMPSLNEMEDPMGAWFYVTDAGMKVELAPWEGWPFDEDNNLRKGWRPPET
jgi:hypothetical protein